MTNEIALTIIFLLGASIVALFSMKTTEKNLQKQFTQFKIQFKKAYQSDAQDSYRKLIFSNNLLKIQTHNSDYSNTHKLGINNFMDFSQQEFIQIYLGAKKNSQNINVEAIAQIQSRKTSLALGDIDWSAQGYVSHVKNQGKCGSCWAFSSVGAVQSAYRIFKNDQTLLSEQQIVDCSSSYGNNGCNGGWMDNAFAYIQDHGVTSESEYPYTGRSQSCQKEGGNYKISSFVDVPQCGNLYNALQHRPVSVAVDASTWALYRQGVLSLCGGHINHGVLVVGATDSFWKIKNSWGVNWGQNGYIRIARGNTCAVCSRPSYPIIQN